MIWLSEQIRKVPRSEDLGDYRVYTPSLNSAMNHDAPLLSLPRESSIENLVHAIHPPSLDQKAYKKSGRYSHTSQLHIHTISVGYRKCRDAQLDPCHSC